MNFSQIIKSPLVLYGSTHCMQKQKPTAVFRLPSEWPLRSSREKIHPSLNRLPFCTCVCFYLFIFFHTSRWHREAFNHVHFLSSNLKHPRSFQLMCARARCTSPTGARGPAGTLCPTSLAQTVAEGLPGGGATSFVLFCLFVLMWRFSFFLFSSLFLLHKKSK